MKKDTTEVDRLLARGRIGGPGLDRIFDEVLKQTAESPAAPVVRRRWPVLLVGATLSTALAGWLLFPRVMPDAVRPKGSTPSTAGVEIRCGSEGLPVCHRGDVLMFQVEGAPARRYLAAYAQPEGRAPSERIWYFPTSAGAALEVPADAHRSVLKKGIAIGADHRIGKYLVTIALSTRPLARSEVDAPPPDVVIERAVREMEVSDHR